MDLLEKIIGLAGFKIWSHITLLKTIHEWMKKVKNLPTLRPGKSQSQGPGIINKWKNMTNSNIWKVEDFKHSKRF